MSKELISKESSITGIESVDIGIVVTHQYITSAGESLAKISKVYGNPDRWKDIFQMNSEK